LDGVEKVMLFYINRFKRLYSRNLWLLKMAKVELRKRYGKPNPVVRSFVSIHRWETQTRSLPSAVAEWAFAGLQIDPQLIRPSCYNQLVIITLQVNIISHASVLGN
jgi:hypothetical protein